MTDAQIEAAARKLCEMRGWKPDDFGHGGYISMYPNWRQAAGEIRAHIQVAEAIRAAAEMSPKE